MGLYHFARWLCRHGRSAARLRLGLIVSHRPQRRLTGFRRRVSVTWTMAQAIAERNIMLWKTPEIIEIAIGMEINAYACAEIG